MRQPQPLDPIEQLREFLAFAVPLRSADLAYKLRSWGHSQRQAVAWLTSEAERAGISLGGRGDTIQFSNRTPRNGRARDATALTAGEIANGIAAAALLAQLDGPGGVYAFGDYYGTARGTAETEPAQPHTDVHPWPTTPPPPD